MSLPIPHITLPSPPPGQQRIRVKVAPYASDCHIHLDDGTDIGLVQAITVSAKVGEFSRATVETICEEAQLEVLMGHTELNVTVRHLYLPEYHSFWERLKAAWSIITNSQ